MELMELTLDRSHDDDSDQVYNESEVMHDMNTEGIDDDDAKSISSDTHFERGGDMISPLTNRSANFNEGSPAGYAVAEAMAAQARALREVHKVHYYHTLNYFLFAKTIFISKCG